ncbi:hypothetical protein SAMN03159463_05025 [Mesorhizobium sp. NFR06]|uniref:terpene synthase/cyclase family protein n=1 Tax=Mesorhizobium sp. NFR06 TaxID=1566290 RepID=UPI0008E1925C|nr:terpene synthase/cyclase family protein [Mesorhizobium sp. NFR06]SFP86670.1 hypothetical protein SAMN03159463_05025 [Mesorhizobium sp. NFR06]
MPERDDKAADLANAVERLVRETGVTKQQAAELILLIGMNWASLIREAKILRASR